MISGSDHSLVIAFRVCVVLALFFYLPKAGDTMENQKRKWGDPIKNCRISLSIPDTLIRLGAPVVLTIVFKNDSNTNIEFPRVLTWFEYDYDVYHKDGSEVSLTPFGAKLKQAMGEQGGTLIELEPGSETTSTVEISRLYDLKASGSYVIQASKVIPSPNGQGFVKVHSNKITVELQH